MSTESGYLFTSESVTEGHPDKIADQIGLKKQEASTEEVLLRLQQLATGYSYFVDFGITYSFGSIFNSTVNPRF